MSSFFLDKKEVLIYAKRTNQLTIQIYMKSKKLTDEQKRTLLQDKKKIQSLVSILQDNIENANQTMEEKLNQLGLLFRCLTKLENRLISSVKLSSIKNKKIELIETKLNRITNCITMNRIKTDKELQDYQNQQERLCVKFEKKNEYEIEQLQKYCYRNITNNDSTINHLENIIECQKQINIKIKNRISKIEQKNKTLKKKYGGKTWKSIKLSQIPIVECDGFEKSRS